MRNSQELHEDYRRLHSTATTSDRRFGLLLAIVFFGIAVWPFGSDALVSDPIKWWALVIALTSAVAAHIRPSLFGPANRIWLRFGLLLHHVLNPVVMAILFFGVVTPYGFAMRLLGRDPMRRRRDPKARTYWQTRNAADAQRGSTMTNQF